MKLGQCLAVMGMALLVQKVAKSAICSDSARKLRHEFQLFAGYSPRSSTLIGTARDSQFALAGLSYGYRCWTPGSVSVHYNAAVMPAAILSVPAQTVISPDPPYQRQVASHAVYGVAVTPVGFMAEFSRGKVRPFADIVGGVIASTEPVPKRQPNATGLNFLVGGGGGIRWALKYGRVLSLGYRFLHISNAGTTSFNPGVDNNVFYIGYSFLR